MKLSLNKYLSSIMRGVMCGKLLKFADCPVIFTNIIPSYVRSMDPLNSEIEWSELSRSLSYIKACLYYSSYRFATRGLPHNYS